MSVTRRPPSPSPSPPHSRFPEKLSREERGAPAQFACVTTAECYAALPFQVHASMPLHPSDLDQEPAGLTARAHDTEAPATGRRRCA